jgi:hypothetical protein
MNTLALNLFIRADGLFKYKETEYFYNIN